MNINYLENSKIEEATNLFREFSVRADCCKAVPPQEATGESFGSEFPGGLIDQPHYTDCSFKDSVFDASNGAFSHFDGCHFFDCNIRGANFSSSTFKKCTLEGKEGFQISNSGFGSSQFNQVSFNGVSFEGTSFRDALIEDSTFDSCNLFNGVFERVIFKNTKFSNIDLRNIGIRFCRFDNVKFNNVVFPILDLATNVGLAKVFEEYADLTRFSLGNTREVGLDEAKTLLLRLIPYYTKTKQYMSAINVYYMNNQIAEVHELLPKTIMCALEHLDFDALYNVCQFITNVDTYTAQDAQKVYDAIQQRIQSNKDNFVVRKRAIKYMDDFKDILQIK